MENTSGASTPSKSGGLRYAPFSLEVYLREYKDFLDAERFAAMPCNGDAETIYDARNGFDRDTALGAWSRRRAHWRGHGAVLRHNDIRYVDMPFVRCEEENGYASRLITVIGQCYSFLADDLPTAGQYYVCWVQPYDQIYFFDNLRHWAKEITLEQRHRTRGGDLGHFVGWHDVEYYAIPPHRRSQFFVTVPSWWHAYESLRLLYVHTPSFFACYSSFTLRRTRRDLLFRVAISEHCVATLMAFLLSAIIGVPSALWNALPGVVDLLSGGVLFPIFFFVREFIDAGRFFQVIRHCLFEASSTLLAYRLFEEIDWEDVRCVGWFPYKGKTANLLNISERQVPGRKRDRERISVTEILSQVVVTYKSSDRMTLSDAQEAARLGSTEDQGDADDGFRIDSDEPEDESAEEVAWDFHDLQDSGYRGTPVHQAIGDLYTKYDVKEPSTLGDIQAIIEDGISSIPRVVELTDKPTEVKEKCLAHTKEHETEIARLNGLAFQRIVLQRKTAFGRD